MKRLISTTAIATLFALPLHAQQETDAQTDTGSTTQTDSGTASTGNGQAGASATGTGTARGDGQPGSDRNTAQSESAEGEPQQMRIDVTSLIGQAIYMPQDDAARQEVRRVMDEAPDTWDMVAEIRDLIVSPDGRVAGVLVDAGGYLGSDEAERLLPMNAMSFVQDGNDEGEYFVLFRGNDSALGQSPAYDPAGMQEAGAQRATEAGYLEQQSAESVELADVNTDDLLGARAYGPQGEWVGEVSELSLAENGGVDAFIIDVGGFLGLGEKPVALDADRIDIERLGFDGLRVTVDTTEEELESMEAWNG